MRSNLRYSNVVLRLFSIVALCFASVTGNRSHAQLPENRKYGQEDKFRQLEELWPTANGYRTADGQPGPDYWQQEADYDISVTLDDKNQTITGDETITYKNHSPHSLQYIWLQLDANLFAKDSDSKTINSMPMADRISTQQLHNILARKNFDGGVKITKVVDGTGKELKYTIVKTMMRIDLEKPLQPGEEFVFSIGWNYKINDSDLAPGRTGCEFFEDDGNYIYEIAQWFPRMVAFTDATGWQHKQYLGSGEFTLELGNYLVRITVPSDHIVGATGVLQNAGEVLTPEQIERLEKAKTADEPMFIVTPDEAKENQKEGVDQTKTWVFHAKNVRDFAFASSRKFIWDAQGHSVGGNEVMAMSLYPNEGEPLWSKYSTHAIIHTLNVYSRYTFDYPYPVAYSVNGPVGGMEYPMICFNGPRPDEDGTYASYTKYALITVIIHEVGHNYFPMIVNTDERQWTWMDEGINTFLQYLSEQEWEKGYPSGRGEPADIVNYMQSTQQVPIMTNSESVLQFGANAYAKPATALNILRETILGRELFDFAFKEYARRWKFKRPNPADFFRTMEDASGVDLDWFWRGWFYSTEHCDIELTKVSMYMIDDGNPKEAEKRAKEAEKAQRKTLSQSRNEALEKRVDEYSSLKDFYNEYDPRDATVEQIEAYDRFVKSLTDEEKKEMEANKHIYRFDFENKGGLVMPVIFMVTFEDGSEEEIRIPAEIWRQNSLTCSSNLMTNKVITKVELDPYRETADVDRNNNFFPPQIEPTRFQVFKAAEGEGRRGRRGGGDNPMKQAKNREEEKIKKAKEAEEKAAADKAAEEKAAAEKAAAEKADSEAKPAESEANDETPVAEKPADQKPAEEMKEEAAEESTEPTPASAGDNADKAKRKGKKKRPKAGAGSGGDSSSF